MFQNISDGQNLARGLADSPGVSGNSVSDRRVPRSQTEALGWARQLEGGPLWAVHSSEAQIAGQPCGSMWTWWRTLLLCGLSFPVCDMGLRVSSCLPYWVVVKIKELLNTTASFKN